MQHNSSVRGSATFLILTGVLLFGALIFALVKNWAGVSSISTQEQARLAASEIIQYGNSLRPVVDRMLLLGGVTDTNIWFSAAGANAAYGVPGTLPSAEVFNPSGGNTPYVTPPTGACLSTCSYEFSGQYTVTGVGSDGNPELVMLVVDIPKNICEKANALLNRGWSTTPTGGSLTVLARFNGSTYGAATAITLTGGSNEFVGKREFCYRESGGSQRYIYLHVIRAR